MKTMALTKKIVQLAISKALLLGNSITKYIPVTDV